MSFASESMERLKLAHDRLHEVIRERDELLKALQAYVQHDESDPDQGRPGSPFHERLVAGRAAIAKATSMERSAS